MKCSIFSITKVALLFAAVVSLTYVGCKDDMIIPSPEPPGTTPILLGKWVQLPQTGDENLDTYLTFLPGGEGEFTDPNNQCVKGGVTHRNFVWASYLDADIPHVKMDIYREIVCGDTLGTNATELYHYSIENDTLNILYRNWARK